MKPIEIKVEIVSRMTADVARSVSSLIRQLSESASPCSEEQLSEIVSSPATTLFVARVNDVLVGMLTLVCFQIPTGVRAIIEDVVVNDKYRGHGIGEELTRAAMERARSAGARTIDLTSRPSREAANRLYQRLGFQQRKTNTYRFLLD